MKGLDHASIKRSHVGYSPDEFTLSVSKPDLAKMKKGVSSLPIRFVVSCKSCKILNTIAHRVLSSLIVYHWRHRKNWFRPKRDTQSSGLPSN